MITLLSTIFVLGVLVFIHELGHFLLAKLFHIRVERFSLGYPPRMVGKKIGDTDYCLSWVPFGGYVKISGMVDESFDTEALKTPPKPWEFRSRPWIQRMLVVFAGPFMNVFFTFAVVWAMGFFLGEVIPNGASVVGSVSPDMPAMEAGILPGDRITAIDGQAVETWEAMTTLIRGGDGAAIEVGVQRGDSTFVVSITPQVNEYAQDGATVKIPQIGIGLDYQTHRMGFLRAGSFAGETVWRLTRLILDSVQKLISGRESIKNLAGPVGIAKMAGESAREGWSTLISFMALLSLNLAILNLLPIPVLDGGHLLFLTIEGVIRREIPLKVKLVIQQVGMALILGFMILVIYNDVLRVFK